MNTSELFKDFPDETSCIQTLKEKRLQVDVVCEKCSHAEHYFRKGDLKFECKKCKSRQSIRTGMVMENSKLPVRYWMLCMKLMTLTRKSFSGLEMQSLIGRKRYEPTWYMMQNQVGDGRAERPLPDQKVLLNIKNHLLFLFQAKSVG